MKYARKNGKASEIPRCNEHIGVERSKMRFLSMFVAGQASDKNQLASGYLRACILKPVHTGVCGLANVLQICWRHTIQT